MKLKLTLQSFQVPTLAMLGFGFFFALGSTPAMAAESSSMVLSHSLQEDYSPAISAQNQSALSLSKMAPVSHKNYELGWSLSMGESIFQNSLNQSNLFKSNASLDMTYHMTQNLSVNLVPSFSYFTGYTQTQNEIQGNGSVWTMKNASLDVKAANIFLFSAGALNQQTNTAGQTLHTSVLMDDRSFPAMSAQVSTGGNMDLGLIGEAGIPTSASLTTQTGDQESNPSFQSFGGFMNYKNSRVKVELLADYFSYSDLPSSVATQSGLLGNTVKNPNGNASSIDNMFADNYRGLESSGKLTYTLSKYWRANLETTYIKNSGAPSDANTAIASKISADWIMARDLMLTPGYSYFKIESDSVVASYNDSNFMPNMVGYAGSLKLKYKKSFEFALSGGERTPLVENPNQFHEHFWSLKLEMLNVAI